MSYVPIVDVSVHQGAIDFVKMRDMGVRAVWVRCANGLTVDTLALRNVTAARDAGLPVGCYLFFRPGKPAAEQGRLLAEWTKRYADLAPQYDLEVDDGMGLRGRQPTADFMAACEDVLQHQGVVYTSAAWWANVTGNAPTGGRLLWSARYPIGSMTPPKDPADWDEYALRLKQPKIPIGWDRWDIWQWSAGGNQAGPTYGCQGRDLDLNIVQADIWSRLTLRHGGPGEDRPPTPLPEDDVTQAEYDALVKKVDDLTALVWALAADLQAVKKKVGA